VQKTSKSDMMTTFGTFSALTARKKVFITFQHYHYRAQQCWKQDQKYKTKTKTKTKAARPRPRPRL